MFAPLDATLQNEVAGQFVEAECKNTFEFSFAHADAPWSDFSNLVWVGDTTRWARVRKTVAHVVVDEDADGNPVVETWKVRMRWDNR